MGSYYPSHTAFAAGQGENDVPVPVHAGTAAEPTAVVPVAVPLAEPGHRHWRMAEGIGMVPVDRPAVPAPGEPPPRATAWRTSDGDSPPEPASAGTLPAVPRGTTN